MRSHEFLRTEEEEEEEEWELEGKLAAAGGVERLAAALGRAEVQATLMELKLRCP